MKRVIYTIFGLLSLITLIGCQNDMPEENSVVQFDGLKFYATFDNNEIRTFIDKDVKLYWHAEDQISLFVGSTINKKYQFNGETGDNYGYFSDISTPIFGSGDSVDRHYAVYPYNSSVKLSLTGVITTEFPEQQTYSESTFGKGANMMVAVTKDTDDYNLRFHNVGSYLRVRLWGENQSVKSITVTSKGGESLAGSVSIVPSYNNAPTCTMLGSQPSVIMNCNDAVTVSTSAEDATDFWVVLPPITLSKGFSVVVANENGDTQTYDVDRSFTFARNTYYTLTRELNIEHTVQLSTPPNNEIWYISTDGNVVTPTSTSVFGANILSNNYSNGKGVIKFDGNVSQVGYKAFYGSETSCDRLLSVSLPKSVKSIGSQAFGWCQNIVSINISVGVTTIESHAFYYCSQLTDITIPDGVTSIGEWAFLSCVSLEHIELPQSMTTISRAMFLECTKLKSVTIPSSITTICRDAFNRCKSLVDITIPDSVKTIETTAFSECASITSITIPNSISSLSHDAFRKCSNIYQFKGKYAADNGRYLVDDGVLFAYANMSGTQFTTPENLTSIAKYAFDTCNNLESVVISNGVISIEDHAFYRCKALISVKIPGSVKTIGSAAFCECSNLEKVSIANGVTTIGGSAFMYCEKLKKLVLPESLKQFGSSVLFYCTSLEELYCKAITPPTVDGTNQLLFPSWGVKNIYVPVESVNLYSSADKWSEYANIIKGYDFNNGADPDNDDNNDDNNDDVTDRTIPNSNEIFYTSSDGNIIVPTNGAFSSSIKQNVYSKIKGKGVITFNSNITKVGADAFKNKTTLTSVVIPESVTTIGNYAFAGTSLSEFTLPSNAYSIGDYAFYGCRNLTNVDLGNVIMIGSYAFKECSLTSVTIPATADSFGHGPFKCSTMQEFKGPNVKGDGKSLYVGYALVQLADGACKNITSYTVPDDVLVIQEGVFKDYKNLKTVTIPEGVATIYADAFNGCTSLKKVILPSSLNVLYNYVFKNCSSLKSIYFNSAKSPTEIYNADESWDLCDRSVAIRVSKGSLASYTNKWVWQDYNVVEFEPGDYSHDDEPSSGGDNNGDSGGNDNQLDGTVIQMQKASAGNGIDIVIMGDGYTTQQIESGKYNTDISNAIELLFDEEPYTSFRHLFNVYQVVAVSANAGYNNGPTCFEGYFGAGTEVGGNHDKVAFYAEKAVSPSRINETMIIVIMNRNYYAGTCYMFAPITNDDYASGASISYFPLGTDSTMFGQLIRHEAGGHGFAKLEDEYAYQSNGTIPADLVELNKSMRDLWGWGKNIDYTSNPQTVQWRHFLNDTRYYFDGLGVYEGGATYWKGVWRPTENSIMNDNTGNYNAPSREAIYYRIHKLAYGRSWTYDYETFVSWDAINRKTRFSSQAKSSTPIDFEPTHPPVIMNRPLVKER